MRSTKRNFAWVGFTGALVCVGLWTVVGCSPSDRARPGTQARWEHKLGWPAPAPRKDRKVADTGPRCLKDRIADPQFVRQEANRLEQARGGSPVTGPWQDKDLSTFAPPQAQFLSANTKWIATDGFDFSTCNDLPCILNKVYGTGASNEGWKIYYFYLAMGYSISCRDFVPATGARWSDSPGRIVFNAPFAAHLFSDAELSSFFKLTYLLPDTYRFMGSQRFHRVPDGDEVPQNWASNTCADSWGNKDHGFIRAKRCIEEDNYTKQEFYDGDDTTLDDNGIRGQFYITFTHEMTHTWDRTQSNGTTADGFLAGFSDTDEWKNLSGWHQETVVTTDNTGSHVSSSRWVSASGAQDSQGNVYDGFVRDYAGQSPAEDLAETTAWVRMRPTDVTQRSPRKAALLSKKIYGGRTYDSKGLADYYTDSAVKALGPQLLETVNNCLSQAPVAGAAAGTAIAGAGHLNLDLPLPEAVVACLESDLNNQIGVSLDGFRATEWQACDLFSSQEAKIRADIFSRVNADVARFVGQNIDRAPIIRATQQLRAALALSIDPREAYVHCFRQAQPEACYQQALSDAFDHAAQSFAPQLGDVISQEKTSYLAQNPYSQSLTRAVQFYQAVFAGVEPAVNVSAENRWQNCMSASSTPGPTPVTQTGSTPLVTPFSGGTHFVSSDLLNCINSQYDADLRTVRDAFISRLGLNVSDADVQALIQGILLPTYLDALRAKEDSAAAAEDAERNQRKPGVIDVLSAQLARDLAWLDGASTSDGAGAKCAIAATAAFNEYFSHVSSTEQLPTRFAAIDDIRSSWSLDVCTRTIAAPAVAQVLAQRAQRAWNDATTALENAIAARARDTATDCTARSPSPAGKPVSQAVRNRRHLCLISTQNWNMVEAQALVDWGQSPEGRGFAVSRKTDAAKYLTAHRKALQAAAIKLMDSR